MSYARRPMGDYKTYGYAGDPGFLSSLWKGVKKLAGPIIGGIIGGPVGTAIMSGALGGQKPAPPQFQLPGTVGGAVTMPGGTGFGIQYTPGGPGPGVGRLPPFTAAGPGVLPGGGRGLAMGVPSGYHYAKDGSGRLVRNRRMNVANPRALRRAMRRTAGFVKLAKRALKGTGYAVRRA